VEGVPIGRAPKKSSGGPGAHVACFRQAVAVAQFILLQPSFILMPGQPAKKTSYQDRIHERDIAVEERNQAIAQRSADVLLRQKAEFERDWSQF
jgi:isoaspartyl peptidase/L-asparaginase-like protein (Ntn-hydrolase superfamily)